MSKDYISGAELSGGSPALGLEEGRKWRWLDFGRIELAVAQGDRAVQTVNFRGRVLALIAVIETVTADTDADATLAVGINGTTTTGGVITMADVNGAAAAAIDAVDRILQGTLVTADNEFKPGDYLNLEFVVTNAFSDGAVRVVALLEQGID